MDNIFFKLIIIIFILAIPICFLYQNKLKDTPKYRQLKTYSNISYDREEYHESRFKSATLFLFTFGHHEHSIKSRSSYDNTYEQYSFIFNKATELQEQINSNIARLEKNITLIIKELRNSSRLVDNATKIRILIEEIKSTEKIDKEVGIIDSLGFTKVDRIKSWLPSFSVFTGVILGLILLLVVWFLVLALGTASTDSSISSPSAITESNGIFSWFNSGGTLTGYLVILAIINIPIIILSTLQSRDNIRKFESQDEIIIEKIRSILDNSEKLENIIILLNYSNNELESYLSKVTAINKEVTDALYKNSAYIKATRKSKALFKKESYTDSEYELSNKIFTVVDALRREIEVSQLLG